MATASTTKSADEIAHPVQEVVRHCAIKGIQTGSALGVVTAIPSIVLWKRFTPLEIFNTLGYQSFVGASVGMVAMAAAGWYMAGTSTDERNYDRAYRLRWNYHQNRVDVYSAYGAAAGGIAGALVTQAATGVTRGGSLGVVAAMIVHALTPVPVSKLPEGFH